MDVNEFVKRYSNDREDASESLEDVNPNPQSQPMEVSGKNKQQ
jgi:hypothetical protein